MLLIDKYAPLTVDTSQFHAGELEILKKMATDESIPHLIFCGPEGSGKKTLINLFLEMLFDEDVHKIGDSIYNVSGSGNTKKDVVIKQSNYHIIIEPNNNNFDRYLIQDVVKEYAKKVPLRMFRSKKSFKVVFINNVDNLLYYAQTALRRTMEKFSGTCRFIMLCKSLSKVISPLTSRCYTIRTEAPNDKELLSLMIDISMKENMKPTLQQYNNILTSVNGNIKKALWLLEFLRFDESFETTYDEIINQIVDILFTCDLKNIYVIRDLLYRTMITNNTGTQIIKDMTNIMMKSELIDDMSKMEIAHNAAMYEYSLIKGRREIKHLEPFVISIMGTIYKYNKSIKV